MEEAGDLQKYFSDLDADFIGLKKAKDDLYTYHGTDVLVQASWELPIVIQWPESKVKFEFCSQPGDIYFGILFVAAPDPDNKSDDLEVETVEEMSRVRSDLELISGSFEVPCEGVLFFVWDNNYDWSSTKKISYLIEVHQPCFTYIDKVRIETVRPLLKECVEDLDMAYIRHADAEDCIEHNSANLQFLQDQLQTLQGRLSAKYREQEALVAVATEAKLLVDSAPQLALGLGIRCLNKHLLAVVLSYLDVNGGVNLVCRYWSLLMVKNRKSLQSGAEIVYREKPTRRTIQNSLMQIRINNETEYGKRYSESEAEGLDGPLSLQERVEKELQQLSLTALSASSSPSSPVRLPVVAPAVPNSAHKSDESAATPTTGEAVKAAPTGSEMAKASTKAKEPKAAGHQDIQLSDDSESEGNDENVVAGLQLRSTPPRSAQLQRSNSHNNLHHGSTSKSSDGLQSGQGSSLPPPPKSPGPGPGGAPVTISYDHILMNKLSDGNQQNFYKPRFAQAQQPPSTQKVAKLPSKDLDSGNNGTNNSAQKNNNTDNTNSKNNLSVDSKEKLSAEIDEIKTLRVSFDKSDGPNLNKSGAEEREPVKQPRLLTISELLLSKATTPATPPPTGKKVTSGGTQSLELIRDNEVAPTTPKPLEVESGGLKGSEAIEAGAIKGPNTTPAAREPRYSSKKGRSSSAGKQRSSKRDQAHRERRVNGAENEKLLQHVKSIRSQQQMDAMVAYLQGGFNKLEALNRDKRRVKKLIRAWNASYEKANGAPPTANDRKGLVRDLYEEYQQISLSLKIRNDKMDATLKSVGLDREGFEKLRDGGKIFNN